MEKLDLDNKVLTVGNTTMNSCTLKGLTRDEFSKRYQKTLANSIDIKEAWKIVQPHTKEKKPKPNKPK